MFQNLTSQGVSIVVSAGNAGTSDGSVFLCFSKYTICVGASNVTYSRSGFSNYGKAVGIFASGNQITGWDSRGNPAVLGGTSLSEPYVSGMLANVYAREGRPLTASRVRFLLKQNADPGFLDPKWLSGFAHVLDNSGYQKTNGQHPYVGAPDKQNFPFADSSVPWATAPPHAAPQPICSIPQTLQVLPPGRKALCKCTAGSLYPVRPSTSTTVFNQQTVTTVDACAYTTIPSIRSIAALPTPTPQVIGSLTLAKPIPVQTTVHTTMKPAPSLACTDHAGCERIRTSQ